jgi:hypothetical protein
LREGRIRPRSEGPSCTWGNNLRTGQERCPKRRYKELMGATRQKSTEAAIRRRAAGAGTIVGDYLTMLLKLLAQRGWGFGRGGEISTGGYGWPEGNRTEIGRFFDECYEKRY